MNLKKKFLATLFDGDVITEEDERRLEEVVDDVEVDDINEVGSSEKLKTEFVSTGRSSAVVQEPIGLVEDEPEETVSRGLNGSQTVFVEPKNYSECKKIANYIKENKTVTVNLENVEGGIAQRILDFLSGASSIKEANFIPVSKRVYVVVPKNVEIVFDGANKLGSRSIKLED